MVILIVDDDPVSLMLAEHILRGGDYDVLTAVDADTAVATLAAEERPIDAIVCDYLMPGDNGLDLLQKLVADEATPCPPFVLLTGVSEADELNDPRVGLVTAYLTKPVKSDELLAVVAEVLSTDLDAGSTPIITESETSAGDHS